MGKPNTKFVRRLIISYSILLIVVLIMGVYLYNISINNVNKEIRNQNKLMLEKTIHDMDTSFKTMDVLSSQIVSSSKIIQLANKPDNKENIFYLLAYHAKENLSVYLFTESILPIKNYYIYLQQSNYILSFSQFSDTRLYYNGIKNYYKDKYEDWLNIMSDSAYYRRFIPIDPYRIHSNSNFLYMLPLTEYTIKKVPAVICFEIDNQKLESIFDELNYYDSGQLLVTDSTSQKVFSLKGKDATELAPNEMSQLVFNNGYSEFNNTGENMFVTKLPSKYNEWTYYLIQPEDASLYSLKQYRNIFIAIMILGLLVEVIVVIYLSRTNIKKFVQLGNELTDTQSLQKSLQKLVEVQKPIILDSYLAKILEGHISSQQELDYAQQYLNITTLDQKFSVLFMVAYVNQYELYVDNSVITGPDNLDYEEIIQKAIQEYFSDAVGIMSNKDMEFSILLSSPSIDSIDTSTLDIKTIFNDLHDALLKDYGIWTFAGMGDWNEGLMITWKSYQQAIQASSYTTKRHTIRCYSNTEKDTTGFYYPIELTNQLTNFITTGNQSQVLEIFEIIRHENMEERSLPINIMKYLLSDIRNTLYKIRFTIKSSDENNNDLESIDILFEQHMSLKLCEDLALSICHLFDNKSSSNKLIVTTKAYIDENYQDPSLCLSKISDEFSISESYFSYLFKEEIGENFSNYLELKRMNKAMDLLKNTDMNISDIYKEVGYNNSHTFRRAFKKIFGLSPKDTRLQYRHM